MKTDYVDLYWLHVWDGVTPVEEVLQTLGDLVRAGRIRYFGFSDMSAWYAVKAATLAQAHHIPGPIALQLEHSLVARSVETEHVPAALECGLGLVPWSPLAAGFLAGKYGRTDGGVSGEGRLSGPNPFGNTKFTPRNWSVLEALKAVSNQLERPMVQVALAWLAQQRGVTSTLTGASKLEQLRDNLASLEVRLNPEQLETLDTVSKPEQTFGDMLGTPGMNRLIFGGSSVQGWR